MQRTGLMHVGWWEGVLSVLANIKADYLRRPPSERRQPEIWLKNHLWSACQVDEPAPEASAKGIRGT